MHKLLFPIVFLWIACHPAPTLPPEARPAPSAATAPGSAASSGGIASTRPASSAPSGQDSDQAAPKGALAVPALSAENIDAYWVYIGTYSGVIYQFHFERKTGKLKLVHTTKAGSNPSFLAIHPNGNFLYAVNEINNYGSPKGGSVTAFSIDETTGELKKINVMQSGGPGPCHVSIDRSGNFVLVANYVGGSVEVIPIDKDGSLGAPTSFIQQKGSSTNAKRQGGPHAHYISVDLGNKYAFVPNLGADKLFVYKFDATTGTLSPNSPEFMKSPAGAGPRHFAFHPGGKFAYLLNELKGSIIAYSYEESTGTLEEKQLISTLPKSYRGGNLTAEIQVHPSGKFVYSSNRGNNTIAMFSVDETTGLLTSIGHQSTMGRTPRNFSLDPLGEYLIAANQFSDDLAVFTVDQSTGKLQATGEKAKASSPVCVKFLPISKEVD
jgi:6-phosphogluconolactonase